MTFDLNEKIHYDGLDGTELINEAFRFIQYFPQAVKCPACQTPIEKRGLSALDYYKPETMSFICFKCGISFTIFNFGKLIWKYIHSNGFTTNLDKMAVL